MCTPYVHVCVSFPPSLPQVSVTVSLPVSSVSICMVVYLDSPAACASLHCTVDLEHCEESSGQTSPELSLSLSLSGSGSVVLSCSQESSR